MSESSVARLRAESGAELLLPGQRWTGRVDDVDAEILRFVDAPILDLGCGPGRHCEAIAEQGEIVLGVDLSKHAVQVARSKGLSILERSVFDAIPKAGHWRSALLLDGNIGIGGDPVHLLQHVSSLLVSGGKVLIELIGPTAGIAQRVRLEIDDVPGPWFDWVEPGLDDMANIVDAAGLHVERSWVQSNRYFVLLATR